MSASRQSSLGCTAAAMGRIQLRNNAPRCRDPTSCRDCPAGDTAGACEGPGDRLQARLGQREGQGPDLQHLRRAVRCPAVLGTTCCHKDLSAIPAALYHLPVGELRSVTRLDVCMLIWRLSSRGVHLDSLSCDLSVPGAKPRKYVTLTVSQRRAQRQAALQRCSCQHWKCPAELDTRIPTAAAGMSPLTASQRRARRRAASRRRSWCTTTPRTSTSARRRQARARYT